MNYALVSLLFDARFCDILVQVVGEAPHVRRNDVEDSLATDNARHFMYEGIIPWLVVEKYDRVMVSVVELRLERFQGVNSFLEILIPRKHKHSCVLPTCC
jgi:hypothetical protein